MGRTHIEVEDDRAFERARDMLNAADIDPEAVTYIEMSVVYVDEEENDETTDLTPEKDEEDESSTEEVEREETTETREREGHSGGGGAPKEPYTGTKGEGAVMPDTHRGRTMQALADLGEWADAREVFEQVDHPDTDYARTGNALSSVANKTNYVEKREKDEYGHREPHNEYRITQSGEHALEAGRKLAAGEKMT